MYYKDEYNNAGKKYYTIGSKCSHSEYSVNREVIRLFITLVSETSICETLLFLSYVSGKEPYALVSTPIASHVSLLDGYHE